MKKLLAPLCLLLVVCLLAGCAGSPVVYQCTCPTEGQEQTPTEAPQDTPKETEPAVKVEGAVKTGLAIITNIADSKSAAADADGEAKYDVTLAAVTVNDEGVIVSCRLDSIGASVKFDAAGAITSDLTAEVLTKNELGDAYNMKLYGGAKYEWYEQAAALADYAVGKTVEQLRAGAVNESGKAADADLATTATIYLGGYVDAIEAAVNNAKHLGAQAGDTLKIATVSSLASSKSASAEADGLAQLDVDFTAITMNGETITSCVLDAVQAKVAFTAEGTVTSDLTAALPTKTQLGDGYNMKLYGGAQFEWFEQAASFAAYVTGKTAAEVSGIAVDEGTKPTDADLVASVTIAVGGFQNLIAKAAQNPAPVGVKTGLAILGNAAKSVSATAEAEGKAEYDITVAAVTVDENGVILSCRLDSIGTTVKFDAAGVITSDLTAEILTKNELGDAYNMKLYGGAKYEWYEQAAALADYAVGKTVEQLRAGAVNESGKAADVDLATTATIYLGGYVDAIEAAVNNAQYLGAQAGDELKLAVLNSAASSASATAEKNGAAQLDVDVTAITMNGEIITSCVIDSLQAKVAFDAAGAITSDLTAAMLTKTQLGDGYNMKLYGGAQFEWFEQAASFAAYVTGKTAAEVSGIAVDEGTKPTDVDLVASVTIAVGGFQALIAKAAR